MGNNPVNLVDPSGGASQDWYQNNTTQKKTWFKGSGEREGYTHLGGTEYAKTAWSAGEMEPIHSFDDYLDYSAHYYGHEYLYQTESGENRFASEDFTRQLNIKTEIDYWRTLQGQIDVASTVVKWSGAILRESSNDKVKAIGEFWFHVGDWGGDLADAMDIGLSVSEIYYYDGDRVGRTIDLAGTASAIILLGEPTENVIEYSDYRTLKYINKYGAKAATDIVNKSIEIFTK